MACLTAMKATARSRTVKMKVSISPLMKCSMNSGMARPSTSKVQAVEGGHVPAVSEHHDPVVERYEACPGRFTKLPAHSVGTEGIDQIQ